MIAFHNLRAVAGLYPGAAAEPWPADRGRIRRISSARTWTRLGTGQSEPKNDTEIESFVIRADGPTLAFGPVTRCGSTSTCARRRTPSLSASVSGARAYRIQHRPIGSEWGSWPEGGDQRSLSFGSTACLATHVGVTCTVTYRPMVQHRSAIGRSSPIEVGLAVNLYPTMAAAPGQVAPRMISVKSGF
jgi:hypothetical protein